MALTKCGWFHCLPSPPVVRRYAFAPIGRSKRLEPYNHVL